MFVSLYLIAFTFINIFIEQKSPYFEFGQLISKIRIIKTSNSINSNNHFTELFNVRIIKLLNFEKFELPKDRIVKSLKIYFIEYPKVRIFILLKSQKVEYLLC